jgi:hypothetical protein
MKKHNKAKDKRTSANVGQYLFIVRKKLPLICEFHESQPRILVFWTGMSRHPECGYRRFGANIAYNINTQGFYNYTVSQLRKALSHLFTAVGTSVPVSLQNNHCPYLVAFTV